MLTYLTKQFGKANLPDIRPGDTIRVSFKIHEGDKIRLQTFEGVCLSRHQKKTLDSSFTLRKISSGIGVEKTFPLHSPLITKFEKIRSRKVRQAKLYFVRDFIGKRAKKLKEKKDYKLWEEALSEEEIANIEQEKVMEAKKKAEAKLKQEQELEKKYQAAISSHSKDGGNVAEKPQAGQSGGKASPKDSPK
ncbi:MAG: 50S ribosomal protein L19 [Patescibacteria group bacterium]